MTIRPPRGAQGSLLAPPAAGRLLTIEGPIGAGKTTLAGQLAARRGSALVLETVEENPFLRRFYEDRRAAAFPTQLFFLVNRFHQLQTVQRHQEAGQEVITDYLFEKDRLFARLNLAADELALYDAIFTLLDPRAPHPDLVIYLRAPVDTLMARVAARGRPFERALPRDYMARLAVLYEEHMAAVTSIPIITIDTAQVDFREEDRLVDVTGHVDSWLRAG